MAQEKTPVVVKKESSNVNTIVELSDSSSEDACEIPPVDQPCPDQEADVAEITSVIPKLKAMGGMVGFKSELRGIDWSTFNVQRVAFLPESFDGNIVFELPPPGRVGGISSLMEGMDKKHDGHPWCRTKTSNIHNHDNLIFRRTVCNGHLKCENMKCRHFALSGVQNQSEWDGVTENPFKPGVTPPYNNTFVCKFCRLPPCCLALCGAKMLCGASIQNPD